MSDVTVRRLDEMETTFGGAFVLARASLGATAFGLQVLDLPPGWAGPEHAHTGMTGEMAHANDGQEEVYFGLEGSAALRVDGQEIPIEQGVMVRCGPSQMRQLLTHDASARVLAIGGVPGGAYTAPEFTELPKSSD
jgi:mannose-6-phosphate isomerase-like protein (cupin superfamily)